MPANDFFGTIASCIASNSGACLFSFLIFVGGVLGWWSFRQRFNPILSWMEKGISLVREHPAPEDFITNFETLDAEMRKNPVLGSAWTGLTRVLIYPRPNQAPRFIRLSHPPGYLGTVETAFPDKVMVNTLKTLGKSLPLAIPAKRLPGKT